MKVKARIVKTGSPKKEAVACPQGALYCLDSIIVDEQVALEAINHSRDMELFALIQRNLVHLARFLAWPGGIREVADVVTFIESGLTRHRAGASKLYFILYLGECVGVISLNSVDKPNRTADIGYWIESTEEGKGVVSRSLKKLVELYANEGDIRRFVIKCAVDNEKSNALALRNGFSLQSRAVPVELADGRVVIRNVYLKVVAPEK